MEYEHLGRSGLKVSRLALGTMNFGMVTRRGRQLLDHGPGARAVREGNVLYVGASNFAGWDIATAQQHAGQRHFMGLVSEQSLYNLTARTVELEVIPALRHYGVGLIPWSPLAGGLLGGALKGSVEDRPIGSSVRQQVDMHRPALEAYEALCDELSEQPADVALAWLLHQPAVTAAIVGPRTREQLTDSQRALEVDLLDDALVRLDEIWPDPGGEAPQAYAW